ncbi:cytoplasmic protein [Vibrio ishigakensis]|uniref:Cytoplasmic protein n=1 Tax=Vibrio ishigakensis TaxID=1481914 RepID=A0A0B8P1M2_9VIBR|nr:cytoplasmic protein [Vibrio ishigakensis]
MAKDFESKRNPNEVWGSKPTKQALECLYMQGDLMISERNNFHKVYDITERVLPQGIDVSTPSPEEHARFLVTNYLEANGIGTLSQMSYLLKGVKSNVKQALTELAEDKLITPIEIAGNSYFSLPHSLDLLNQRLNRRQAKILSPFDNLLIQRKRAQQLFDFDYLLECYVPQAKRKYGYFCLPILWDGDLVAMADCKTNKKESVLEVLNLFVEPKLKHKDAFIEALQQELMAFAKFNNCSDFEIQAIQTKKAQ